MAFPHDTTEPMPTRTEPQNWDLVRAMEYAEEQARAAAQKTEEGADALLDAAGLPSVHEIRDDLDEVRTDVEELVEEVTDLLPEPWRPHLPELPTPGELWDAAREGAEWVDGQFERVGDSIERTEELPPPELEPGEAQEDDGWDAIDWIILALLAEWLSGLEVGFDKEVSFVLWTTETDDTVGSPEEVVFAPDAGYAARLGDQMAHGGPVAPGIGSATVRIGGKPALRACDVHVCTATTPLPHVSTAFVPTCRTVRVEGFELLRVTDAIDEGPYGLNPIITGCPTVRVGPKPKPVKFLEPGSAPIPDIRPFGFTWDRAEVGVFKGNVHFGLDINGPLVQVNGEITAAKLYAEDEKVFEVPLGNVDFDDREEALRISIKTETVKAVGVSDVDIKVWPVKKKIKTKITPKPPEHELPKTTVTREIVEVKE